MHFLVTVPRATRFPEPVITKCKQLDFLAVSFTFSYLFRCQLLRRTTLLSVRETWLDTKSVTAEGMLSPRHTWNNEDANE